jgi:hypothetical protein
MQCTCPKEKWTISWDAPVATAAHTRKYQYEIQCDEANENLWATSSTTTNKNVPYTYTFMEKK